MHKCARFNKRGTWPTSEQREAVTLAGCKKYKELTIKSMFMHEKGEQTLRTGGIV